MTLQPLPNLPPGYDDPRLHRFGFHGASTEEQRAALRLIVRHLAAQPKNGTSQPRRATVEVIKLAFEKAGVAFIDENGGGAGLRVKKAAQKS